MANGDEGASASEGYSTYRVQVEVTRNGVPVGAQDATVPAGETLELARLDDTDLRVLQRVSRFPGAADSRALVEFQVFRTDGERQKLMDAPTLGVELGETEVYEVKTVRGVVRIQAIVEGAEEQAPRDPEAVLFETVPMGEESPKPLSPGGY